MRNSKISLSIVKKHGLTNKEYNKILKILKENLIY